MRINKLFSNYGICSRKDTARLIEEKRIIVNGEICTPGKWVEESDEILLDNKKISKKEKIYIALNKPIGVTCTVAEDVKDNIKAYMNFSDYIFPVGRLDKESQGLILLTNDGELANKILESENLHEKEYVVTVDKPFSDDFISEMASGVKIDNIKTRPCKVRRVNENTFNIILTQGLNRQIRKMTKAFGFNVTKLDRIRIVNVTLDGIEYGKWRHLTKEEVSILKKL